MTIVVGFGLIVRPTPTPGGHAMTVLDTVEMTAGRARRPHAGPWITPSVVRHKSPEADLKRAYRKSFWVSTGLSVLLNGTLAVLYPTLEMQHLQNQKQQLQLKKQKLLQKKKLQQKNLKKKKNN